jgi:hypothetical protein
MIFFFLFSRWRAWWKEKWRWGSRCCDSSLQDGRRFAAHAQRHSSGHQPKATFQK